MAMHFLLMSDPAGFERLRGEWTALLDTIAAPNPFVTWEWQYSWWQVYGPAGALRLVLAYDGTDRLCGIAPLYRAATYVGPIRFRTLEFVGARHVSSEYLDVIASPDRHAEVVSGVLEYLRTRGRWDLLLGFHTPVASPTLPVLARETAVAITRRTANPYVHAGGAWGPYLSSLSKKTRDNVKYYRNVVAKKTGATYRELAGGDVVEALPGLAELHQARMRQLGFPGSFADGRFIRFQRLVAERFAPGDRARMFVLGTPDRLVAANYGFIVDGTFFDYSMGFDPALQRHSVGFVLFSYMLERCVNAGLDVDFLDPGEFKELWNPLRREHVCYAVGASPSALATYLTSCAARSAVVGTLKTLLPPDVAHRVGLWKDALISRIA